MIYADPSPLGDCAHCGKRRPHHGRGLCSSCIRGRNGCDRRDYERRTWPSAELVSEFEFLARQGYTRRTAAQRLGITKARLEKAIERHTRRTQEAAAA